MKLLRYLSRGKYLFYRARYSLKHYKETENSFLHALKQKVKQGFQFLYHQIVTEQKLGPYAAKGLSWVDRSIAFMLSSETTPQRDEVMQWARPPIVFGGWVILITFGVFGLWAALFPIDSAAVARGVVVVESNKKTIQHLEGGVIAQIYVKEGDQVELGQPLIRLSEKVAKSHYDSFLAQLRASTALEARLVAERDDLEQIVFPKDLTDNLDNTEVRKLVETQKKLFFTRKAALEGKIDVLKQRIGQLHDEINSLAAQEQSAKGQLSLIREEIVVVRKLMATGDALKTRLLALQRKEAELKGGQEAYLAQIAKAKQGITEAELEIMNAKTAMLNETVRELRDTQVLIADLQERVKAAEDILDRLIITSPQRGTVNNLAYHTVGGVITPGTVIMDIIPQDDKLVIEAQILPQDIDVVHQNLPARIRLTAFKSRTTPVIEGKVTTISADRIIDKATNVPFYKARITLNPEMFSKLKDIDLYPGMPADVLIITGSRTFLQYLFNPITDSFRQAFREQ